ncbi:MAG: dienelactone hydrolase family protein [Vulcanococcus sp.]
MSLPAVRVQAEWVTIPVAAQPQVLATAMPAWWARPAGVAPRAGVLVLPEVFGVNGWVRGVAERLAEQGYAALAISTFSRTAPDLDVGYDEAGLLAGREHRDQVSAPQLLADVAAGAAWLQRAHAADGLAGRPLGCVGFCFGGHLAMLAATRPEIAATCDFYGARVASFRPGGGPPSLEVLPQIPGRLWCFRGDADPLIPAEEMAAIEAALTAANGGLDCRSPQARHRLLIAPGAGHGYLCEARADFHPEAAAAGWAAMLALFGRALGSGR